MIPVAVRHVSPMGGGGGGTSKNPLRLYGTVDTRDLRLYRREVNPHQLFLRP